MSSAASGRACDGGVERADRLAGQFVGQRGIELARRLPDQQRAAHASPRRLAQGVEAPPLVPSPGDPDEARVEGGEGAGRGSHVRRLGVVDEPHAADRRDVLAAVRERLERRERRRRRLEIHVDGREGEERGEHVVVLAAEAGGAVQPDRPLLSTAPDDRVRAVEPGAGLDGRPSPELEPLGARRQRDVGAERVVPVQDRRVPLVLAGEETCLRGAVAGVMLSRTPVRGAKSSTLSSWNDETSRIARSRG